MLTCLNSVEYQFVKTQLESLDYSSVNIYGDWLSQTYYFVSHSVRLSALAVGALPVDCLIGKRMLAHTNEENGHHIIAKKDIDALGKTLSEFPAYGVTKAFFESQYYKVLFDHPYSLLGQILMLENLAVDVGSKMYPIIKSAHGVKACSFVKIHCTEDINHVKKALQVIDGLSIEHKLRIQDNFYQACEMYSHILRMIEEKSRLCKVPQSA